MYGHLLSWLFFPPPPPPPLRSKEYGKGGGNGVVSIIDASGGAGDAVSKILPQTQCCPPPSHLRRAVVVVVVVIVRPSKMAASVWALGMRPNGLARRMSSRASTRWRRSFAASHCVGLFWNGAPPGGMRMLVLDPAPPYSESLVARSCGDAEDVWGESAPGVCICVLVLQGKVV